MKTGIFITARMGSTRLPEKHLLKINGREIMGYLVSRIIHEFSSEIKSNEVLVVIVTGNRNTNFKFETSFKESLVFYGDDDNIPKRHLEAAEFYGIDLIVSVDGDDILCSPNAMREVYNILNEGYVFVKTNGLPLGLNVWGYSTSFLKESLKKNNYSKLETGWGRIFNQTNLKTINFNIKNDDFLRFTLDYKADLDFFTEIIKQSDIDILTIKDDQLIDLVINKNIYKKNMSIAKEYWKNFKKNIKKEET